MIVIPIVEVDLNNITMAGLIKTTTRYAPPLIQVGDKVLAVEPDDHVSFKAKIHSINRETGRIMLEMDWDSEQEYVD